MARPKRDNDLAARALADAFLFNNRTACDKNGITDRTLRRYRSALDSDAELSAKFAAYLAEVSKGAWGDDLNDAISDMLGSIRLSLVSLESQTTSREEHLEILSVKMDFLKTMLEPALAREVMLAVDEPAAGRNTARN